MGRIIVLETDFGYKDPYVGVMKAVIKRVNEKAEIIDLTHGIPSFDILSGAYVLYSSFRYFPSETLFVVVVDPGVGTERLPIIAKLCNRYFIAPNNGVIYPVVEECMRKGVGEVRSIDVTVLSKLMNEFTGETWKISNTFHGRDVFAPAAAMLSQGINPSLIAPRIVSYDELAALKLFHQELGDDIACYNRIYVDKFGNIVLSVRYNDFNKVFEGNEQITLLLGGKTYDIRFGKTFSDVDRGELVVYENSFGFAEIGVNQGSAHEVLGDEKSFCFVR